MSNNNNVTNNRGESIKKPENDLYYMAVENKLFHLTGTILTAIDASIVNEKQNKALKDVIKNYIRVCLTEMQESASGGNWGHSVHLPE